jgi:hypothetical protein
MNNAQEDAPRALQDIEASRLAMRSAIRAHRGHLLLWLWGLVWIAMSALCRIDRRLVAVCAALLGFGCLVWPILFGGLSSYKAAFGYSTPLWMPLYIVAGIWFDNYLLWVGLAVSALVVAEFLLVPGLFWALTILCGAVLVGRGFNVRYIWR